MRAKQRPTGTATGACRRRQARRSLAPRPTNAGWAKHFLICEASLVQTGKAGRGFSDTAQVAAFVQVKRLEQHRRGAVFPAGKPVAFLPLGTARRPIPG